MSCVLFTNPVRRKLLKGALGLLGLTLAPAALAGFELKTERHLAFFHLHTEESLAVCYWRNGDYIETALEQIDYLLRDHRTAEHYPIDRTLLDLLALLHHTVDSNKPFHIISGYRSPKTNAQLRANSTGVAQMSLHMLEQAIDIRLPDIPLNTLYDAAVALQAGGVGLYPGSNFIHVDTGRVRHWQG